MRGGFTRRGRRLALLDVDEENGLEEENNVEGEEGEENGTMRENGTEQVMARAYELRAAGDVDPDLDRIFLDLFGKNMKRQQIPGAGQATSIYFPNASSSSTGGSGVSKEELQAMREQITIEVREEMEQQNEASRAELESQNAALRAELERQSAASQAELARQKVELRAEFAKENERVLEQLFTLSEKVDRMSTN